jgi:exodeoxyribonuclease VII large subunit
MAQGQLVQSVAAAQAAGAVTLHFKDGTVGAAIGDAQLESQAPTVLSSPPRPARKAREVGDKQQQDLFS